MREIGRGEEGAVGVTVAAAVAILEKQQEEQRRTGAAATTPSSSSQQQQRPEKRKEGVGETVAYLQRKLSGGTLPSLTSQSKFSGGGKSHGGLPSDGKKKNEDSAKSVKNANNTQTSEKHTNINGSLESDKRKLQNSDSRKDHVIPDQTTSSAVKLSTNKVLPSSKNNEGKKTDNYKDVKNQYDEGSVNDISKSTSITSERQTKVKNPESLNKVESGDQGGFNDITKSSSTKNLSAVLNTDPVVSTLINVTLSLGESNKSRDTSTNNTELPSNLKSQNKPPVPQPKPSFAFNGSKLPCDLQRSSSTKEALDHKISAADYDDDGLGLPCHTPPESDLQNSVSDSNIPRKRPRVVTTEKSSSGGVQPSLSSSSLRIVLEYPPPPTTSPPPQHEGSSSPVSSPRVTSTGDSLGGDETSPDEEEEDSTLKCGTAWSGSDSATHHRSSSTSDFSSSTSDEAEDLDHSPRIPSRPSEDLNSTGCDEDFQWVHGSPSGDMESIRRHHPSSKSNAVAEKRTLDVRTPESDGSGSCNDELDYDPPEVMHSQDRMTPSYDKVPNKTEVQSNSNDGYDYHRFSSENSEVVHRKPPRHDSNLKPPAVPFDKTGSLDRRRAHSQSRASRDQKARSSIILHSPRYQSPSRRTVSPSPSECRHYNNSCCNDEEKHFTNHGISCCNSASNLLHCSSSHECIHRPVHPVHCCSSSSLRDDIMSASYDSSFSENHRHHHHHQGDLQRYGSAGKLDYHARMCHGSQPDLMECCGGLHQGGNCFGSHGYLPVCNCRWQHVCKQPPGSSDVEERLRRLEADKDSLQLQVTVLTEQIEVQTDKISDLEKLLEDKKRQLANAEDVLQREMLQRSSLETQKLELLSAMSELKLQQAALERDNLELRDRLGEERRRNKPPVMPRTTLISTSTPISSQQATQLLGGSPSPSPVSSLSEGSPRRLGNHPNSCEDFKDIPQPRVIIQDNMKESGRQTPPANYRRKVEHYGSLPRQRVTTNGTAVSPLDGVSPPANVVGIRKGVAFAETERIVIEDMSTQHHNDSMAEEEMDGCPATVGLSPQPSPSFQINKSKGIKKIFGKMKRSGSGNLDELPGEGEFRRGGVRATAGPRLGWTNQPLIKQQRPDQPFVEWDSDAICRWLQELGLDCYAGDAKRWVKTGTQLLQASNHELEKELGIKNPLHRKKLHLALLSQQENVTSLDPHLIPATELDTAWVLRWLDDAGLPQHKETFLAARIDGRVLHRLTMDDLAILHVTSHLHVASLRRGIQVLRDHKFEPNCLKRRSLPDDPEQPTAEEVALWTNHRVMEWLRVVDLAEYAPNLRGSGVHGGLMVHEPRFTAELLASLLSIPPSKTLLRRHLNTHFKELLGRDCIQEKREAEATLGYVPLSATTKVKITKKSQFTLKRKKSKSELDFGDLVCPLDPSKSGETQPSGDGTTRMEALPQRVVAVSHEMNNKSPVDKKKAECKLPERTSNV